MADRLRPIIRQFVSFGAVGVVGFVVDAGVLTLMLRWTHAGFYLGRLVSFLCAATVTWLLNKTITFAGHRPQHPPAAQWLRFVGANALGGLVNFAVYSALLANFPFFRAAPVLAVAAGSLSGLVVNFGLSRVYVFRSHAT